MDADSSYGFTTVIQPIAPVVWPSSLNIDKGSAGSLSIDFGQGADAATEATIAVADGTIAAVSNTYITTSDTIIVTGLLKGTTDITVTFNDASLTSVTIPVTVNPVAPFWPAGSVLTGENITYESVLLRWTPAQDITGVIEYRIYKDGVLVDTVAANVTTCDVIGLSPSTSYTFQIQAGNADDMWTTDGPTISLATAPAPSVPLSNIIGGSDYGNITNRPGQNPNDPVIAVISLTPFTEAGGNAVVIVSGAQIAAAISKAQNFTNAQVKTANGISVAINVDMKDTTKKVSVRFSRDALQVLVNAGVKELQINGIMLSLKLDLKALKEILSQSAGDVTIEVSPVQSLSGEAEEVIGSRPVFDVTISYNRDGKTVNISDLGEGTATILISYAIDPDEAENYLFGVYVDEEGKAHPVEGSAYDAESGCLIISTNHFSVYGVGYTAPSAKFTDIQNHWALKSIDYVIGRGLLAGTTETTFSPDTPLSRGLMVMALGKLAGVDVNDYKTITFTDVTPDNSYAPYVEWAYRAGIVKGIGNNMFAPDRNITREEVAIIFANYTKAIGYKLAAIIEATPYADEEQIGSSFKEAVKAMKQAGIMIGGPENKFYPKGNVTRAEFSSMLYRFIQLTANTKTAR